MIDDDQGIALPDLFFALGLTTSVSMLWQNSSQCGASDALSSTAFR